MQTEDKLKKRMQEVLKVFQSNPTQLSKEFNVNQKTLNSQINAKTTVSASTIILILTAFEQVSAEWLLRGNGDIVESTSGLLSGMSQRIRRALTILVETKSKVSFEQSVADALNYEEETIIEILETNSFSYDFMQALVEKLNVNPLWIITGQGSMTVKPIADENRTIDKLLSLFGEERKRNEELVRENELLKARLDKYENFEKEAVNL